MASKQERNQLKLLEKRKAIKEEQKLMSEPKQKINVLAWGATPFVITGFGNVMKEILTNLYKSYPGQYNFHLVGINFHGDYMDEFQITGGLENGRLIQWPAAVNLAGGQVNLYGQTKFLDVLRETNLDIDVIFIFEDPFWVGGLVPGIQQPVAYIDAIKQVLHSKGRGHVPVVCYFPIDGVPKQHWIENIAKYDMPITYLNFGANECVRLVPELKNKLSVIPHGVNNKDFYPVSKQEAQTFKRAMFGDRAGSKYMVLNVNRNQLRKLIPSSLLAFKSFQQKVPDSFMYLNMKPVDVGWNLFEVCEGLGLEIGNDVFFPDSFLPQKGLSIEELNLVFNCADMLVSTATGGGWELAVTQAFATKTVTVIPANTSHVELAGSQADLNMQRGVLYRSGSNLSQLAVFTQDNEVVRPLPDLDHMVEQMYWVYTHPEEVQKITDNAHSWVTAGLLWDQHIVPQFHQVFSTAKKIKQQRLEKAHPQQLPPRQPPSVTGLHRGNIKLG